MNTKINIALNLDVKDPTKIGATLDMIIADMCENKDFDLSKKVTVKLLDSNIVEGQHSGLYSQRHKTVSFVPLQRTE